MDEELAQRYHLAFAAAYVRGRLGGGAGDDAAEVRRGLTAGLRLVRFKRTQGLARVERVLGLLKSFRPSSLLDVGTGRGTFLWPLLEAFPDLPVTAVDLDAMRVADLAAVEAGGIDRLQVSRMDVTRLAVPDGAFDGVTLLEVLEHLQRPAAAAAEALRASARFVIASVPAHADDNPDHHHLFDRDALAALFAGARSVRFEQVLNHIIAVVQK